METTKAPRTTRSATGARPTTERSGSEKPPEVHYLVLQGDVLEMVTATERPSLEVQRGERRKVILASGTDKAAVEERYQALAPLYPGLVGKGEAI